MGKIIKNPKSKLSILAATIGNLEALSGIKVDMFELAPLIEWFDNLKKPN